jgi:hypothetical protein
MRRISGCLMQNVQTWATRASDTCALARLARPVELRQAICPGRPVAISLMRFCRPRRRACNEANRRAVSSSALATYRRVLRLASRNQASGMLLFELLTCWLFSGAHAPLRLRSLPAHSADARHAVHVRYSFPALCMHAKCWLCCLFACQYCVLGTEARGRAISGRSAAIDPYAQLCTVACASATLIQPVSRMRNGLNLLLVLPDVAFRAGHKSYGLAVTV